MRHEHIPEMVSRADLYVLAARLMMAFGLVAASSVYLACVFVGGLMLHSKLVVLAAGLATACTYFCYLAQDKECSHSVAVVLLIASLFFAFASGVLLLLAL